MFKCSLDRRRPDFIAAQNLLYGREQVFLRLPGHKAIAINVRPDAAHLQNRRFREEMTDGEPYGFLHLRLHCICHQDDIKRPGVASHFHVLETESRIYFVAIPPEAAKRLPWPRPTGGRLLEPGP